MRRIVLMGMVTGVAAVGVCVVVRSRRDRVLVAAGDLPEWPPLQPIAPPAGVAAVGVEPAPAAVDVPAAAWVEPAGGACPLTHPVKGNVSSGIYHVPGGRFYDTTRPGRCYLDAAAAEADGLRASKR